MWIPLLTVTWNIWVQFMFSCKITLFCAYWIWVSDKFDFSCLLHSKTLERSLNNSVSLMRENTRLKCHSCLNNTLYCWLLGMCGSQIFKIESRKGFSFLSQTLNFSVPEVENFLKTAVALHVRVWCQKGLIYLAERKTSSPSSPL